MESKKKKTIKQEKNEWPEESLLLIFSPTFCFFLRPFSIGQIQKGGGGVDSNADDRCPRRMRSKARRQSTRSSIGGRGRKEREREREKIDG